MPGTQKIISLAEYQQSFTSLKVTEPLHIQTANLFLDMDQLLNQFVVLLLNKMVRHVCVRADETEHTISMSEHKSSTGALWHVAAWILLEATKFKTNTFV